MAEVTIPMQPRSAAIAEYTPAAPKWLELTTETTATPISRHLSTARFIACADTAWPKPLPASISAVAADSRTIRNSERGRTWPVAICFS